MLIIFTDWYVTKKSTLWNCKNHQSIIEGVQKNIFYEYMITPCDSVSSTLANPFPLNCTHRTMVKKWRIHSNFISACYVLLSAQEHMRLRRKLTSGILYHLEICPCLWHDWIIFIQTCIQVFLTKPLLVVTKDCSQQCLLVVYIDHEH